MSNFECKRCAKCCRHIRGDLPEEDKKFVQDFYYGKLPIIWVVPLGQMTFPLMPWEAKRIKEIKPDVEMKPLRIIYDLKSSRAIVVAYFFDEDACKLEKDGVCPIYKDRPYVCKQFPIQHVNETIVSDLCPNVDKNTKDWKEYFGQSYTDAVEHAKAIKWFNDTIFELIKNGTIRPAVMYPYDYLMKRYENSKKIDFLDFLKEEGIKCPY
jgi:Fe-S-cluster containining protein